MSSTSPLVDIELRRSLRSSSFTTVSELVGLVADVIEFRGTSQQEQLETAMASRGSNDSEDDDDNTVPRKPFATRYLTLAHRDLSAMRLVNSLWYGACRESWSRSFSTFDDVSFGFEHFNCILSAPRLKRYKNAYREFSTTFNSSRVPIPNVEKRHDGGVHSIDLSTIGGPSDVPGNQKLTKALEAATCYSNSVSLWILVAAAAAAAAAQWYQL